MPIKCRICGGAHFTQKCLAGKNGSPSEGQGTPQSAGITRDPPPLHTAFEQCSLADHADDDSDGCSVGSDDTVSVAMSFMSTTTAVSLHPSRHCLERMLERDVDVDEMRVTKKYGQRSWVGKGNHQTECRIGWRIVVPVRELRLPGRDTEAEITCWRNPITGIWAAPCGARYCIRHYNKLSSRGVVCLGVGSEGSFFEI